MIQCGILRRSSALSTVRCYKLFEMVFTLGLSVQLIDIGYMVCQSWQLEMSSTFWTPLYLYHLSTCWCDLRGSGTARVLFLT